MRVWERHVEFSNGVYDGKVKVAFRRFYGCGVAVFNNGKRYEGEWRECKARGRGKLTYPEGAWRYEGEFRSGKRHGQGKMSWTDGPHAGCYLEGKFRKDEFRKGKGRMQYDDNSIYEGEFLTKKKYGDRNIPRLFSLPVERIFARDGDIYEDELYMVVKHGNGKITFPDGSYMDGVFINDNLWGGEVRIISSDGSIFEGRIFDRKKNGQGKYTSLNGSYFEGIYKNNIRWEGKICTIAANGDIFEGEIHKGQKNGQGRYTYPDGSYFEGTFKNNKPVRGKIYKVTSKGMIFEGELIKGFDYYQGKKTYPDGTYIVGVWKYGGCDGKMYTRLPSGEIHEEEVHYAGKATQQGKVVVIDASNFEGIFKDGEICNSEGHLKFDDGTSYEGEIHDGEMTGQGKFTWPHGSYFVGELRYGAPWTGTLHYEKGDLILIVGKNGPVDIDEDELPMDIEYKAGYAI